MSSILRMNSHDANLPHNSRKVSWHCTSKAPPPPPLPISNNPHPMTPNASPDHFGRSSLAYGPETHRSLFRPSDQTASMLAKTYPLKLRACSARIPPAPFSPLGSGGSASHALACRLCYAACTGDHCANHLGVTIIVTGCSGGRARTVAGDNEIHHLQCAETGSPT
jgi:hypothetical protein